MAYSNRKLVFVGDFRATESRYCIVATNANKNERTNLLKRTTQLVGVSKPSEIKSDVHAL